MQTPSVGRIVHFHEEGGPYAAIIAAVNPDGTLELATLGRNSLYFQHGVSMGGPDGTVPTKGCWTWPPYMPPAAAPAAPRHCTDEEIANGTCKP